MGEAGWPVTRGQITLINVNSLRGSAGLASGPSPIVQSTFIESKIDNLKLKPERKVGNVLR